MPKCSSGYAVTKEKGGSIIIMEIIIQFKNAKTSSLRENASHGEWSGVRVFILLEFYFLGFCIFSVLMDICKNGRNNGRITVSFIIINAAFE